MNAAQRPRAVVLGLDGLPWSLARDLAATGKLPNLASLAGSKNSFSIQAELPELSPVNWTSFYTASGPGTHGIFGFSFLDPQTYRLFFADSGLVRAPSIFDRLGEHGLVSKVVNLPNTYPVRPLKGMLIAGFVAPDLQRAVYPGFLLPRLRAEGYRLEADTTRGASDPEHLLSELAATLRSRRTVLDLFWPDLAWDLFVFVLTETDRLGHFLFPALTDQEDPLHGSCMDLLQQWDALIGEVLERFEALPEPKRLIALADHGFAPLETEVDLNVWLRSQGLLRLGNAPQGEWDATCIAPGTQAFALDPGRIYLHDRERFARGRLDASQALRLREEIATGLRNLAAADGRPAVQRVHFGEELYPEAPLSSRPDLVCVPNTGFDLKAKFDREDLFGFFGRRGMHTPDDAFCYDSAGPGLERVRDAGAAVLDHLLHPKTILI